MKPEILSPGGSPEAIYSAIHAGCDAIYMGGKRFGARAFADNPDEKELLDIIDNIHLHNKKIYLTVNTILTEAEFKPLYSYIDEVYRQGVDAVIVQDFGVMKFIHENFPDLPIHASTQMSIMGADAVNMLCKYGITRIVPARELSIAELKNMRKNTSSEIEVFVHGALCCSMSGQCLMSSMIGGRSGNRGACAQPCRKQYSYNGGDKEYYLSLKDLNTLPHLNELISCGIDSFKIEGRMKKPEYVAVTTMMYRKYTDYYFEMGYENYTDFINNSKEYKKDIMMLSDIYNRGGFTSGYLVSDTRSVNMLSGKRPGHEGVCVGEIADVSPNVKKGIRIRFSENVNAGDVLEIRNEKGIKVHDHTLKESFDRGSEITVKAGYNEKNIKKGFKVFRIRNNALIDSLGRKYPTVMPKVSIQGKLTAKAGKNLELSSGKVSVIGNIVGNAMKHAADVVDVKKKIMVSGDTEYEWQNLEVDMDDNIFLPAGELKQIRRELLSKIRENTCAAYRRDSRGSYKNNKPDSLYSFDRDHKSILIAECRNAEQFNIVNKSEKVSLIYLHVEDINEEDAGSIIQSTNKPVYIFLPRVYRNFDDAIYKKIAEFDKVEGFIACTIEEMEWFGRTVFNRNVKLCTADNLYVRNTFAYDCYRELGAKECSLSVEMSENELKKFPECNCNVLVYGRISVMIMLNHHGDSGSLKDEYKNNYTIIPHKLSGYTEILNYEAVDFIDEYKDIVFDRRVSFTTETEDEIRSVLRRCRK